MRHIIHYGNGPVTADCNFFSVVRCAGWQGAGGFMSGLYDFGLLRRLAWFDDYGLVIVIGVTELGGGHLGRDKHPAPQYETGSRRSHVIYRGSIWSDDGKTDVKF